MIICAYDHMHRLYHIVFYKPKKIKNTSLKRRCVIDLHVGICSVSSSASRAGSFSTVTFRMGVWGYRPSPNSLPAIKSMLPAKKSRRPAQTEKASVLVGYTRPLPGASRRRRHHDAVPAKFYGATSHTYLRQTDESNNFYPIRLAVTPLLL
jgi:hypothetical protein